MNQIAVTTMHMSAYISQQHFRISWREPSGGTQVKSPDRLEIGWEGITTGDALKVVTERVLAQLKAAVDEMREILGVGAGPLDTSPEATAERIFNFAMGLFDAYRGQHPELDDETAREGFVRLVRAAVRDGIQDARDILTGIAPISDSVNASIDRVAQILENRFTQFLTGNVSESALGNVAPTWSSMTM